MAKPRYLFTITAGFTLPFGLSLALHAADQTEYPFDWIPASELTESQQLQLNPGCQGLYVDPLANQAIPTTFDDAELIIESERSLMEDGEQFLIEGDVKVEHGARSIRAESMLFNRQTQTAKLDGEVKIRNPGLLIEGDNASVSTQNEEATFEQARFVMHEEHMRGSADSIEQKTDGVVVLKGGSITTCEPNSNTWRITGEEIRLDQNKRQGTARNVSLRVADIPIIYLPWFSFPLGDERQSGFLVPAIASSESGGLDLAAPWYWNIAPNYDMTITPRLVSGRGAMLETENRYMNRSMTGKFKLAYLADDNGGADPDVDILIENGDLTESQARPHIGNNRWLVEASQRGGLENNQGWYSYFDLTKVSDVDYFRDIGNESFSQSNLSYVDQLVQVGYLSQNWHLHARAHERQRLLADLRQPLRILPQINMDGEYRIGRFKLRLDNEITHFDHDDSTHSNGSPIVQGVRQYLDYRLSRAWRRPWGFLNTHAGYKHLAYQLDDNALLANANNSPSVAAAQLGLDMGLVFERKSKHFLHTLEPRVFRFYRERADHSDFYNITGDGQHLNFDTTSRTLGYGQFYRDTRFTGHDRLDDSNRSTLGITSRWLSNDDGRELLQINLGQVLHYSPRRVSLNGQPEAREQREIAASASLSLGAFSRIYASGIYNRESDRLSRASAGFRYASPDSRLLANLGWSWVRDFQQQETITRNLDQIDASFLAPLNPQWNIMGRYNYDIEESQHLETFLGLEYKACCYRIRVLARKWLDSNIATLVDNEALSYDEGLFFEFHLKGLGGSGARVNTILSDSIPGYDERENKLGY